MQGRLCSYLCEGLEVVEPVDGVDEVEAEAELVRPKGRRRALPISTPRWRFVSLFTAFFAIAYHWSNRITPPTTLPLRHPPLRYPLARTLLPFIFFLPVVTT